MHVTLKSGDLEGHIFWSGTKERKIISGTREELIVERGAKVEPCVLLKVFDTPHPTCL